MNAKLIAHRLSSTINRARLLPLRLLALTLCILLLLVLLASSALRHQSIQAAQRQAQTFRAQTAWVLQFPSMDQFEQQMLRMHWSSNDWLADRMQAAALPTVIKLKEGIWLRAAGDTGAQRQTTLLVNHAAGLAVWSADALPACVWLDGRNPGQELILNNSLRCKVVARPSGWQALALEFSGATLALHIEHASALAGANWVARVDTVLTTHSGACQTLLAQTRLPLQCQALVATRGAGAVAGVRLATLQDQFALLALVAAVLSLLIYGQGLLPLLTREAALRLALGVPHGLVGRWLLLELLLQWLLVSILPTTLLGLGWFCGLRLPPLLLQTSLVAWLLSGALMLLACSIQVSRRVPGTLATLGKVA